MRVAVSQPYAGRRIQRLFCCLWAAAIFVTVVNVFVVLRRLPVQRAKAQTPQEKTAVAAGALLRQLPTSERILLLLSHKDVPALWFHYRLGYLLYPQRHDVAWETLPVDAARRYDIVLAYGKAQASPERWIPYAQLENGTLFSRSGSSMSQQKAVPYAAAQIPVLRVLFGLLSLAAECVLGLLLVGVVSRKAPFRSWIANLAVANLIGASIISWLVLNTALLTGRPSVAPVYIALILFSPAAVRAWKWLGSGLPAVQA